MRAITLDELQGFRDAMLELCIPIRLDAPVMDVCGTGGDGKNTFNISTLASFIVAAAGQPVAKHGNFECRLSADLQICCSILAMNSPTTKMNCSEVLIAPTFFL